MTGPGPHRDFSKEANEDYAIGFLILALVCLALAAWFVFSVTHPLSGWAL